MAAYIVRRVLISIGVLLVASFLLYLMVGLSGDPLAALKARPGITQQTIDTTARSLGLDQSIFVRYWNWLTGVLTGDWGTSVALGAARAEVLPAVGNALWVTIRLVVIAELLALLIGGAVGAIAALKQYSITDYVATTLAFVLFAMPVFCIGIILKVYGIQLNLVLIDLGFDRWLTTAGPPTGGFTGSPGEVFFKFTGAYLLPTIALAAISFAAYSRFQRASMLETMRSDYVRTARAKGLTERQVVLRHALRNALLPVTTYFAYNFGAVFGGAIVTEQVFGWNGMGSLLVRSIQQYDPNMLMGWLIVTATIVVLFNLLADIAYSYLDPRIVLAETTQTTPALHPGKVPGPPSGPADGGDVGGAFLSQGQLVRRRFLRHRAAMTALTILVLFVVFVYVAPFFLGYSLTNLSAGSYEDPSPSHIFGTDQVGADVFSLVMKGSQFSLQIGVLATAIATVIGVLMGTFAGYLRRGADTLISRVTDLFLVVPLQAAAAVLIAGVGGSWWLVGLVLGFFLWTPIARVTRAEALALSQREFIEAARSAGATTWRIVTKHLVPNMIGTIVVNATLTLALAVLTEAALSFIGLGVQIPDTSLGLVLNQNYTQLATRPWLFWAPFTAIVLISLTINFIGDGLRDAFDPRQTRR